MATVLTIMPAGGGDYTTLQAWWDDVDDAEDADQWAECYEGGIGAATIAPQIGMGIPDADTYVRIYAAEAGVTADYINLNSAFARIEGIEVRGVSAGVGGVRIIACSCLDLLGLGVYGFMVPATTEPCYVRNCVVAGATDGIHIVNGNMGGTVYLDSNTSVGNSHGILIDSFLASNVIARNNVCVGNTTADIANNFTMPTWTGSSHNACGDGTATSVIGGSGNIDDATTAAFTSVGRNALTPSVGSDLLAAGVAVEGVETDILGDTRADPPTLGAYEEAVASLPGALGLFDTSDDTPIDDEFIAATNLVGTENYQVSLRLRNIGDLPLTLDSLGIAGTDKLSVAAQSDWDGDEDTELSSYGDQVHLVLDVDTSEPKAIGAQLSIASNDTESPYDLNVYQVIAPISQANIGILQPLLA